MNQWQLYTRLYISRRNCSHYFKIHSFRTSSVIVKCHLLKVYNSLGSKKCCIGDGTGKEDVRAGVLALSTNKTRVLISFNRGLFDAAAEMSQLEVMYKLQADRRQRGVRVKNK